MMAKDAKTPNCPLLMPHWGNNTPTECQGPRCGWWSKRNESCSMVAIAEMLPLNKYGYPELSVIAENLY